LDHYRRTILKDPFNEHDIVYKMNVSRTGKFTDADENFELRYGSAGLNGMKN